MAVLKAPHGGMDPIRREELIRRTQDWHANLSDAEYTFFDCDEGEPEELREQATEEHRRTDAYGVCCRDSMEIPILQLPEFTHGAGVFLNVCPP